MTKGIRKQMMTVMVTGKTDGKLAEKIIGERIGA